MSKYSVYQKIRLKSRT